MDIRSNDTFMTWLRENRWRILLTIILAILWCLIWDILPGVSLRSEPSKTGDVNREYLEKVYTEYNAEYFGNKLPKDVVIDYNLHDPEFVALTRKPFGPFHISFNPAYAGADRTADLTMLHEMCHIKTWGDDHGSKWRACMIELELGGAFRVELIDSYKEKK